MFISLTELNGRAIRINMNNISSFYRYAADETRILSSYYLNNTDYYKVKETPEEIDTLIQKAKLMDLQVLMKDNKYAWIKEKLYRLGLIK